jgi:hypothetical protein
MNRMHECKYDDSLKRSRTAILQEKLGALEAKLRDLESESSSYTPQGTSPLSLSDSSGGGDSLFEPIISLSAEMHNTLYVVHNKRNIGLSSN